MRENLFPFMPTDLRERFISKIQLTASCWNWTGTTLGGYGVFSLKQPRRSVKAHRKAFEWTHGTINPNLVIDHLCRNKACVNPAHLELVTNGENVLRGFGPCAVHARKTHCKRGHEFTAGSYFVVKGGGRDCKACKRLYYLENKTRIDARKKAWDEARKQK
jgi:hypothetical protein